MQERGIGLAEALVAASIASIAVLAMIFALVSGNATIRGMRIERAAYFVAQQKLENLLSKPWDAPELDPGSYGPETAVLPYVSGQTSWDIVWVDDPLDGTGGADSDPQDYRKVEVTVSWDDAVQRNVALNTLVYP